MLVEGPHERRLLKQLFVEQQHNPLERPVTNDSEALTVDVNFSLLKIIDYVSEIKSGFHLILLFIQYK